MARFTSATKKTGRAYHPVWLFTASSVIRPPDSPGGRLSSIQLTFELGALASVIILVTGRRQRSRIRRLGQLRRLRRRGSQAAQPRTRPSRPTLPREGGLPGYEAADAWYRGGTVGRGVNRSGLYIPHSFQPSPLGSRDTP